MAMTTADGRELNPILRGTAPSASWNQTWIDRSTAKRAVPMKVLVLGWPRTGSKSTSAALYILGFDDVYHFSCLLENPPDCKMWKRAIDAKWNGKGQFTKKDIFHAFAEELIAAYPDAKVLLNVRPTDKWYESVTTTVFRGPPTVPWWFQPFVYLIMYFGPVARLLYPMQIALRSGITHNNLNNEALREAYEQHNERIKATVPADRLLLWGPQDGWELLCKFLEMPLPSVPVPFVNESKAWTNNMRGILVRDLRYIMRKTFFGAGLSLCLFFVGRRYGLNDYLRQSLVPMIQGIF